MVQKVLDENIPVTKIEGAETEILSPYIDKFKAILGKYNKTNATDDSIYDLENRIFMILESDWNNAKLPFEIFPDIVYDSKTKSISSIDFYRKTKYTRSSNSLINQYELDSSLGQVDTIDDLATEIHMYCDRNNVPLDTLISKLKSIAYQDRLTDKAVRLSINILSVFGKDTE